MKKLQLSVMTALLLLSTLGEAKEEVLETITIATKSQKSIDGVAASVEVITQEQIEQLGSDSLKDILEKTAGIIVQYGTFPSASAKSKASVSIRGMSANGTLFLLDGRRLAGEVANPYDLDRIPASMIERIEIVKGPMSSLYGADAVGGVINIITKKAMRKPQVDANARYGTNEYGDAQTLNLGLSLQGKEEALSYSAYGSIITTDPYVQGENADVWVKNPSGPGKIKPSTATGATPPMPLIRKIQDNYPTDVTFREESNIYTLGSHLGYDVSSDLALGFDVNYFTEERDGTYVGYFHPAKIGTGLPVFNIPVNSRDENSRLDLSLDASYVVSDTLTLKSRIYKSSYEKRNSTTAIHWADMNYASQVDSSVNGMDADVEIHVAELSAIYAPNEEHLLTFGGEYRDELRNSSVFTRTNEMTQKSMDYKSLYVQDEWQIDERLSLIAGARYDSISNAQDKPTLRLGGMYEFNKLAKLRANFAQGYRVPDIRELYISKQTPNGLQIGADVMGYELSPESTNAYEIGISGRDSNFHYDVVGFYNQVNDMIAQVMGNYNGSAAFTFENVANAKTYGVETTLEYGISKDLDAKLFWSELRTQNEETKRALEFQPERMVRISLNYAMTQALDFGLIGRYIGEQHYTDVINRGAPSEQSVADSSTNSFTLADLNLNYKLQKNFSLYGGVNNLFDGSVDDILGANVGRYYFAGARVKF